MSSRPLAWLLALCCVLGCEGIGRPIVSRVPPDRGLGSDAPCTPVEDACDEPFRSRAPFAPVVTTDPTSRCELAAPCSAESSWFSACTLSLTVAGSGTPQPINGSCFKLGIVPQTGVGTVQIAVRDVEDAELGFAAVTPTTITLQGGELRDVRIQLRGPVTLQLLETTLDNVSIESDEQVTVRASEIVGDELLLRLPQGGLEVTRSVLTDCRVQARDTTLSATVARRSELTAQRLIVSELEGESLMIDAATLTLTDLSVMALRIERCEEGLITASSIAGGIFAPCLRGLTVHGATIANVRAQGAIESRGTQWDRAVLGSGGAATELELWTGTLSRSVLCSGLTRLPVSAERTLLCNACGGLPDPAARVCNSQPEMSVKPVDGAAGPLTEKKNEYCPVLDEVFPACSPVVSYDSPL
jgi:hypothetical protein